MNAAEGKMDSIVTEIEARRISTEIETQMTSRTAAPALKKPGFKAWGVSLIALGLVAGGVVVGPQLMASTVAPAAPAAPPTGAVSARAQGDAASRLEFLGQFSAVQSVELRAQVGGTLTQIGFK